MAKADQPDMRKTRPRPTRFSDRPDYNRIHKWARRTFVKSGTCERCERPRRTEWAFRDQSCPLTQNRADWIEVCKSCHEQMDGSHTGRRKSALRYGVNADNTGGTT